MTKRSTRIERILGVPLLVAVSGCGVGSSAKELEPVVRENQAAAAPEGRRWFQTPLVPSGPISPKFGSAVALSGDTALVGSDLEQAAYVFVRGDGWEQQAKLLSNRPDPREAFGRSVAIAGDLAVVGAPERFEGDAYGVGAIYVFERSGSTWSEPTWIMAYDPIEGGRFGAAVATDGEIILVGAPAALNGVRPSGAVYVLTKSDSGWEQRKIAPSDDATLGYGAALALLPHQAFVGAPEYVGSRGSSEGLVSVLDRADWTEAQTLYASPSAPDDRFGHSIAVSGEHAVFGAPQGYGLPRGYRRGQAYVYGLTAFGWNQETMLVAPSGAADLDLFGTSVGISGTTVMAGAFRADSVFVFSPFTESMPAQRIGEKNEIPFFGVSLAMEGDVAVVGAGFQDEGGAYIEELLATDGSVCEANADCGNRHCDSGVCCDRACEGECASCETGTCSVVGAGEPGSPSCAGYLCDGTNVGCPHSCDSNGDCAGTHYCKGDECVPTLSNGSSCDKGRECQSNNCADGTCRGASQNGDSCSHDTDCNSGFCVDGLCCNSACSDQCEACDVAGSRGTCSPVVDEAPHGSRDACDGDEAACKGMCKSGNTRGCTFPDVTTPCGTSCEDGVETAFTCDGRGACVPGQETECNHLLCETDEVCKTSCEDGNDCLPGYNCVDGACEARAICVGDSSRAPDGSTESCSPFVCDGDTGLCLMSCSVPEDCISGNTCYPNGDCAPPEEAEASNDSAASDGCSCSSIGRPHSPVTGALLGLVLTLGIVARRRRRRGAAELTLA